VGLILRQSKTASIFSGGKSGMSSETEHTIEAGSIHDAAAMSASDVLYQEVPERHPGLSLESMEAKLKTTTSPVLQKFLRTQIERLKQDRGGVGQPSRHPVMRMPAQKVEAKLDPSKRANLTESQEEKPARWVPPNRPLTIEDIRIRRTMNAAAEAAEAADAAKSSSPDIAMTAVEAEAVATSTPEGTDKEAAQVNSANNKKAIACPPSTQSDKSDAERTATKMKWVLTIGFFVWVLWQVANGVFTWGIRLHWWGHTPGKWNF
jgi:hypothetical protein